MEELFGPLRAAGWNPRMMDRSVVHYDNSVAAGYPTDIGDVYSDDQAAPTEGEDYVEMKINSNFFCISLDLHYLFDKSRRYFRSAKTKENSYSFVFVLTYSYLCRRYDSIVAKMADDAR